MHTVARKYEHINFINHNFYLCTHCLIFSAIPGVSQRISAAEISQTRDNNNIICIILVTWDPPANSDTSDIGQYIVYVPSRNIRDDVSSSTITTLTVSNCGVDTRVQVAAVNSVGCIGLNSSEVPPVLLDDIPNATAEGASTPAASSKYFKVP